MLMMVEYDKGREVNIQAIIWVSDSLSEWRCSRDPARNDL